MSSFRSVFGIEFARVVRERGWDLTSLTPAQIEAAFAAILVRGKRAKKDQRNDQGA